jgi:molecular chaperone GrpE
LPLCSANAREKAAVARIFAAGIYKLLFPRYNPAVMGGKDADNRDEELDFDEVTDLSDDVEAADIERASAGKQKQLRDKLKRCEEEKRQTLEDLQRVKADFLNGKRRLEEQLSRDRERITEKHVEELLPLADSFEAAMSHKDWQQAEASWQKGIEGIYAQLQSILRAYGVEAIDDAGSRFDPLRHEAVSHEGEGDTVVKVLQRGYRIGERVIRPARVAVGAKE